MHPDCEVRLTVIGDYISTMRSMCGYTLNKSPAHHRVIAGLLFNHNACSELKRTVPLTLSFRKGFCFKSIRAAGFCCPLRPRICEVPLNQLSRSGCCLSQEDLTLSFTCVQVNSCSDFVACVTRVFSEGQSRQI